MSTTSGTRELTPAGKRVLNAATDLFYAEGLHAVGVEAIARRAEVTKKTLYDCFGSKDELICAYLRRRDERWRTWLVEYVEHEGGSPRDQILATFDALAEWQREHNPRGCAFINALAELPEPGHPAREVIADQKRWVREYLTRLATEAGLPNPAEVAERAFLIQEGALVAHSIELSADPFTTARRVAEELLF